jgi:DNA-binding SARP family transcriptional activator
MKPRISIRLFGKFSLRWSDQELLAHVSKGAREILAYLVVHRSEPVPRETLAGLIAPHASLERSRKAVRQALWSLRSRLVPEEGIDASHILEIADGWIQLRADAAWLDVREFEHMAVGRAPVESADPAPPDPTRLAQSIELYRGDLLQGWYHDWCLEERERLRQIYLETLDALVAVCESNRDVNAGVAYGIRALHSDPARECTHRSLMRLYCLSGDRASAIRQYDRCVEALRTELGVEPEEETRDLGRAIRAGIRPGCRPMDVPESDARMDRRPLTLKRRRGKP